MDILFNFLTIFINLRQIRFLNKYTNGNWYINEKTGLVDIDGDFRCSSKGLKDFKGVQFGVVKGDFDCSHNNLTSLVGAPQEVRWNFYCSYNNLTSLAGAPQKVGDRFNCSYNNLTSLAGAPQKVGSFECSDNKLTSLVGAPQKVGSFDCSDNKLTSLVGAPQIVWSYFICYRNPISSNTLKLVWNTMKEKKVDYWTALCILKREIPKSDLEKLEGELDKRIPKDAQKGISMLGRFGHFD